MACVTKKKVSPRGERRQKERIANKLAGARERLANLEAGGAANRPITVQSASQIEPHALATACLRCDGPNRLEEHAAETIDGERLRVARKACARCGVRRVVWFRITTALPS
jgi:hypothetical protein